MSTLIVMINSTDTNNTINTTHINKQLNESNNKIDNLIPHNSYYNTQEHKVIRKEERK